MLFPTLVACPIDYSKAIVSAAHNTVNTRIPCDLWSLFVSFCFLLYLFHLVRWLKKQKPVNTVAFSLCWRLWPYFTTAWFGLVFSWCILGKAPAPLAQEKAGKELESKMWFCGSSEVARNGDELSTFKRDHVLPWNISQFRHTIVKPPQLRSFDILTSTVIWTCHNITIELVIS